MYPIMYLREKLVVVGCCGVHSNDLMPAMFESLSPVTIEVGHVFISGMNDTRIILCMMMYVLFYTHHHQ